MKEALVATLQAYGVYYTPPALTLTFNGLTVDIGIQLLKGDAANIVHASANGASLQPARSD